MPYQNRRFDGDYLAMKQVVEQGFWEKSMKWKHILITIDQEVSRNKDLKKMVRFTDQAFI